MSNFSQLITALWNKIKSFPLWIRAVVLVLVAAFAFFMSVGCGVTRAVVHNGATGTTTEIKISTSNPTTVTASPNVKFEPNVRD